MTRVLSGRIIPETKFSFPFRMILAGSSGSGKTHFAGELLKRNDLFDEPVSNIYYYYPFYLDDAPVDWHNSLDIPVIYNFGLPTKEELTQLPSKSCIVIDDSFDEAVKSSAIDHLFRVISGKRKLCVMIMTQNNFTKGKYGREIRNSCNFSVLFRNCCDTSINKNIAKMAGLSKAYNQASLDLNGCEYPYMFIDQSQRGQLTPFRLFTNIFARYPTVWSEQGMKGYVIGAQDFETFFKTDINGKSFTARENAIAVKEKNRKPCKAIDKLSLEISDWDTGAEAEDQSQEICKSKIGYYDSDSSNSEIERRQFTSEQRKKRSGGNLQPNKKRTKL